MDSLIEKIQSYESKVNRHKSKREKLKGKLEVAEQQLAELGFDNVEDAEAHIKTMTDDITTKEEELRDDINEFERIYAEFLED